jgi:transcription termination factor Rho
MFVLEKAGWGVLRREEAQFLPSKEDIWVPQHLVHRFKLRDGAIVSPAPAAADSSTSTSSTRSTRSTARIRAR